MIPAILMTVVWHDMSEAVRPVINDGEHVSKPVFALCGENNEPCIVRYRDNKRWYNYNNKGKFVKVNCWASMEKTYKKKGDTIMENPFDSLTKWLLAIVISACVLGAIVCSFIPNKHCVVCGHVIKSERYCPACGMPTDTVVVYNSWGI